MSEDRPLPSPRTAKEPMAFTRDELLRGAFCAWGIFMALMLGSLTTWILAASTARSSLSTTSWQCVVGFLLMVGIPAVLVGGVSSLLVMALGLPVAWSLGRALRRVAALEIHLLVYSALGVVIGAAAVVVLSSSPFPGDVTAEPIGWTVAVAVVVALPAAVAVPAGWWLSARSALRENRWSAKRGRDADAEFEDAAVSRTDER